MNRAPSFELKLSREIRAPRRVGKRRERRVQLLRLVHNQMVIHNWRAAVNANIAKL